MKPMDTYVHVIKILCSTVRTIWSYFLHGDLIRKVLKCALLFIKVSLSRFLSFFLAPRNIEQLENTYINGTSSYNLNENILNSYNNYEARHYTPCRQVTRAKSKSGAVVKHQRRFVVLKTTSNKSSAAPLYRSLVTSLPWHNYLWIIKLLHAHMYYKIKHCMPLTISISR